MTNREELVKIKDRFVLRYLQAMEDCDARKAEDIDNEFNEFLFGVNDRSHEEGRKELFDGIMKIDLAPDAKTLEQVEICSGRFEAFGYGQGWVFRKIETLYENPELLNKL